MIASDRFSELAQDERVHRRAYCDPDVFRAEMERVFARTWLFVGHESEIPVSGSFKTDHIGRKPIVLVRGKDNRVRVLYNVCRHRAAKVCYERYGETTHFRCMYHGWTYDTAGTLVGIPLRDRFRHSEATANFDLIPVPRVETYRGFIFATSNGGAPPLERFLGRGTYYLDLICDRAPTRELLVERPIKCEYAGNWKLAVENYTDNYHPSVLHQSALDVGIKFNSAKYGARPVSMKNATAPYMERTFGAGHGVQDFGGTRGAMWMNAYGNPDYLASLQECHAAARANELAALDMHVAIYPNLLLASRMNNFRVVKPIAVDKTEIWTYPCRLGGAPDDVNDALILNTSQHVSAMGEIQVDDLQCYAWIQEGLQVDEMEWVLLKLHGENERTNAFGEFEWNGSSEEIVRHQYREWSRLMLDA